MTADSRRLRHIEACLFFGLWILYGILIDDYDVTKFNLQQMGVEAIVERGVFYVDGSPTPELEPGGDVFEHDGHLYAAKQPGQFMAGALVYAPLHWLGLSYAGGFLPTASLVTFFTTSLLSAAAAVCVFRLATGWAPAGSLFWPLLAALSFGLGTSALPYSGVAHHDAIASAYLLFAFTLVNRLGRDLARRPKAAAALAGLFLGLTLATSMLPFFMVAATGLYFLALRRWGLVPYFIAGGAAGIAPLVFYNTVNFGNPFLVANLAGDYSDTFFFFDWRNLLAKLGFYATRITGYVPIVWLGLAGYALLPRSLARERIAVGVIVACLVGYVCNIETIGGCQYGPRYLLPMMPYAALGLAGFAHLKSESARRAAAAVAIGTGVFSAAVNLLGAMYGTMYCDLRRYAFAHYLDAVRHDVFRHFPLALWLVIPLGVWLTRLFALPADRAR